MESPNKTISENKNVTFSPFVRQLSVCFTTWLTFFMFGMSMGTPTVTVPQLRRAANSTLAVSNEMASWLVSISGYSGSVWVVITTIIAYYIGRKKSLLIVSANTFIASTVLYFSTNVVHVLISQFLHGMTSASQMTTLLMIITEYTSANYRGIFLTLKSATFFWGIWVANAIGIFTHYKYIGLLGILCSIYNLTTSVFIPESPYWLAFKGRYNECAKAHRWLKGGSDTTEKELENIINTQKERIKVNKKNFTMKKYIQSYLRTLSQPEVYKPISLSLLVTLSYHFSGKFVCAVYAIEIMKNITPDESTAYIGVLALDGFSVLGMYVGACFSKILKRRTLLFVSLTVGTLFLFTLSLYLYLVKMLVLSDIPLFTIIMLAGFSVSICCGPMILSTSISGELLPMKSRSFCIVVYGTISKFAVGCFLKTTPYIFRAFEIHGTFLVFGLCSLFTLTLMYKYVPETKDKTLYEIAELFRSNPINITLVAEESTPLNAKRNIQQHVASDSQSAP